jgi:hypothetical protein
MATAPTSLTIDRIDPQTFQRLQSEADSRGVAIADLARTLLEQSVAAPTSAAVHHDLDALAGTWSG